MTSTKRTHNLVQRLLRGESSSYEDIVSWYAEDILRLCFYLLRDKQEAEDVLQEALLRLVRLARDKKIKTNNGSIKGLLSTIARNLCIDRLRKARAFHAVPINSEEGEIVISLEPLPDSIVDSNRFEEAFSIAIDQLNKTQRVVFVLVELEQTPYAEIAKNLEISVDAVRQHFYRARQQLTQILKPYVENT